VLITTVKSFIVEEVRDC